MRIIRDPFKQGLSDTLRNATVDLSLQGEVIEYGPNVIDSDVANDFNNAGVLIDFDLADVATIGKRRGLRIE